MALFILLLFTCTFISCFHCAEESKSERFDLEISPASINFGQNLLLLRVDETLNLTCRVISELDNPLPDFRVTWHLPYSSQNSQNRVQDVRGHNVLSLLVQNLQEADSGEYKCQAVTQDEAQTQLQRVVRVNVKNKKISCTDQMFMCPSGICIAKRYMCDGRKDCKTGADEAEENCGQNPCESKLHCDDGRCIPTSWCCDQFHGSFHDPNCTSKGKLACCQQMMKSYVDPDSGYLSEQQRFSDMGFLQTTIYTVIGCAMAFMFIVTILVIAICRVHMKRSLLSRCPGARGAAAAAPGARGIPRGGTHHHHGLQHVPLYDLDVFLNRSELATPHSGLLVTYNINNGVQFVGRPVDPPPYCEIVASPPREGPPPPYTSQENLDDPRPEAEALLDPQGAPAVPQDVASDRTRAESECNN